MRSKKTPLMRAVCFHFLKKTEHGLNMYKKKKKKKKYIYIKIASFCTHGIEYLFAINLKV